MEKNKVKFGLKNAHYAKLNEAENGTISYGTIKPLKGAVSLTMDAQGDDEKFYADDVAYYVSRTNDGYSGSLELALIPDDFLEDIQGAEEDATDKVQVEKSDAHQSSFALLFEFDGDKHGTRHVLYNCTAGRSSVSSNTKSNSTTPVTETLPLTAVPLADGVIKAKTKDTTSQAIYDGWFDEVWRPHAPASGT